jgi:hypothetical protein
MVCKVGLPLRIHSETSLQFFSTGVELKFVVDCYAAARRYVIAIQYSYLKHVRK